MPDRVYADEDNALMLAMRLDNPGLSMDRIAGEFGCSQAHVQKLVAKWRETEWGKLSTHRRAHLVASARRMNPNELQAAAKRWGVHVELVREAFARGRRHNAANGLG